MTVVVVYVLPLFVYVNRGLYLLPLPLLSNLPQGNLAKNHPLCDMPAGFVNATLAMHNRPMHPPVAPSPLASSPLASSSSAPPLTPPLTPPQPAHKVFVSFDGRGDASGLRDMGCVFSSVLDGR